MRWGQPHNVAGGVAALQGFGPYWRLAYNHEWGPNSLMLGTYGMQVNKYPDNLDTSTATDRFRDFALDAQYQYITDPHTVTAQATYIWEKQWYNASYPVSSTSCMATFDPTTGTCTYAGIGAGPTPANATDTVQTFKGKLTYYYQRKYGATVAYFNTTGSSDAGLYGTDPNGNTLTPKSNGYIWELDYVPIPYVKLMLQYTGYWNFNGGKSYNFDTSSRTTVQRSASANNTLFVNVWAAF